MPAIVQQPLREWTGGAARAAWGGDDLCYVFMTSGSTGNPKRIAGRYKAIGHFVAWEIQELGCGAGTRVSQVTAPIFDAFLRDMFVPLCSSGTICVPPFTNSKAIDGVAVSQWLQRERINVMHCVPSFFRGLMSADLSQYPLDDLRHVLLAGEPLFGADVAKWMQVRRAHPPRQSMRSDRDHHDEVRLPDHSR